MAAKEKNIKVKGAALKWPNKKEHKKVKNYRITTFDVKIPSNVITEIMYKPAGKSDTFSVTTWLFPEYRYTSFPAKSIKRTSLTGFAELIVSSSFAGLG